MLDTSGILSNHFQKLASANISQKQKENEYTEVERLLSSISKRKLKQALEEVNFDVYQVLLRDLSSNVIFISKHATSVLSSLLEIARGGIKDKKSLLGSLVKIILKNKSLDDVQLCCDALKCTRMLIDAEMTLGHEHSVESFISEQLDVSSNKPEPIVIESLLVLKELLEFNLVDLRDKTNFLLKCLLNRVFDKNSDVRVVAIAVFNVLKPRLSGSEKYLDDLENNLIKSKFSKQLIELMPTDKNWAVIWRLLLELMGKRFHHNSSLVNSLLAVEEKAFKSYHVDTKKEAFINWKKVILSFASDRSVLSSERRVKLLAIPLRANNCRSMDIALAKFDVWWFLLVKLQSDVSRYLDLVLTPFLKFCYGPFSDSSLPSANGQSIMNNVNNGEALGRLYPAIRVPCMQALTLILCYSAASALPPHLAEGLVVMSPTEPFLKSSQDFCCVSRILTQCVGEATLLTSSDSDFAWIVESWRSLLVLINRGSGETSCFDDSNSKDVKNVSLVKDVLRLLINLVESLTSIPDSKMYGKVLLSMIEAMCIGDVALHPSVLNSHIYSVGNSQLMTGSPTLLLASLLLSPTLVNSKTDQSRYMMVFSKLLSLGLSSLAPPLPFIRKLLKKLEVLTASEQMLNECFPIAKLIWIEMANQLSESINKDGTVSEGNDAHHDFQCMYGLLIFPVAHFLKTDCEKENPDILMKPWEKLFKLFFINSQFLITSQPSEVIEELCRKILVYVKRADTSLNYISCLVNYVLVIFSINFYEDYWKSTIGILSKGERTGLYSSRQLLYALFYKICDLICTLEGSSVAGSEKHASIMSYLVLVLSIGLNHDLMGFLFEKAAASVRYYLELTSEKCPKALEKEIIQLWEKFLEYVGKKVISQKRMTQYHKDILIPLLEAGFLHHNTKLVELTKSLWNKTLGEQFSDVTIPTSLAEILENVLRDDTESEGPELMVIKQKPVSTSPFKCPVLQKNLLHVEKKQLSSLASTLSQGNGVEFVAISPRQKSSSVLTDHQKDKLKMRRVDIPALYQDLTQDSQVSQSFSQEIGSSAVEPSAGDVSEDANPPFPKALLRKDESIAAHKESPSRTASKGLCVTNSSGLPEDKKGGEIETVFTELRALESEKSCNKRKQLLKARSDVVEEHLPILEKTSVAKGRTAGSVMNNSSLKENKAPEVRCIQSEAKSADIPSVSSALIKPTDEENVIKSPSARIASATKVKTSGLSVSSSNEERTCNQPETESVDVSSSVKPGKCFPQIEGSESKEAALLPGADAIETPKESNNESIMKAEANNLSKQISPSTLVPTTSADKCIGAPLQPAHDLVESSNDLNGSKKEVSGNEDEMLIVDESSKPVDAPSAEVSPIPSSSRKSIRKSSRGKTPLPSTPLSAFSDSPAKDEIISESSSPSSTISGDLRRKRGRPKRLGTPSPIAHIRKISLQQQSKRLTETKEIESIRSEENHDDGEKEGKESVEKTVPATVSVIEEETEIEENKEDINVPKDINHQVLELDKKTVIEDKIALLSPKKSPATVLESPVKREGKAASPSLKPKFVIESPKRKSPILSGSLDDWVIVKKTSNAGKGETKNADVPAAVTPEINLLSESKKAVCISPPEDLVESSQEPISPGKAMTKNCSVNLSRMSGIFSSENAEVAFIAYQGSVIKCNLSPSKKEDKEQRKDVNAVSVATNLFPSPRSKTGRGARMLNLAQNNKEEGASSPLMDVKSPQESPKQLVVGEWGCSTPPMKKPRRIRPMQIGDVSPQYRSLEIGCVVSDGAVTLHEYSPSASPKGSLMKKKRKATQELGEDSLSPSAKKSRRVSFADPIVSKHVEFCIPESERKFKKRAVIRCLKMPIADEMDQGPQGTSEEEVAFEGFKEVSSGESSHPSSVVKINALDSFEQLGVELPRERKTCDTAPSPSIMGSEENVTSSSASVSKSSSEETCLEKSSPEGTFDKEVSSCQPVVPEIKDNVQRAASDVCDENSFKKSPTSGELMEDYASDSGKIEDLSKTADQSKATEFPSERKLEEEACPELRDCSDPIDEDLWERLSSRHWRERCKAHLANKYIKTVGDLSRLTETQMDNIPFKNKKWKTLVDALLAYKEKKSKEVTPEITSESETAKESDSSGDLRTFRDMLSKLTPEEIAKELKLCSSVKEVTEHLVQSSQPCKDFVSVSSECKMHPKDLLLSAVKEGDLEEAMEELSDEERMKLLKWLSLAAKKSAVSSIQPIRDFLSCAISEIRCESGKYDEQFKWLFQNVFHPDEQVACISSFLRNVDSTILSLFIFEDDKIMKNIQKLVSPKQAVQIMISSLSESKSSLPLSELNQLEDLLDKQRSSEDLVNRFTAKILERLPKDCDKH